MLQRGRAHVSADGVHLLLLVTQARNTSIATACVTLSACVHVMLNSLFITCLF